MTFEVDIPEEDKIVLEEIIQDEWERQSQKWQPICDRLIKNLKTQVILCVGAMQKAGTDAIEIAKQQAKLDRTLELVNTDINNFISAWYQQAKKSIKKKIEQFKGVNKEAAKVKAIRVAKVAGDVFSLTKNIAKLILGDLTKIPAIALACKNLYDDLRTLVDDIWKKVQAIGNLMGPTERPIRELGLGLREPTLSEKVKFKLIANVVDPLKNLNKAVDTVKDEIKLLKSSRKKLGRALSELRKQSLDDTNSSRVEETERQMQRLKDDEWALNGIVTSSSEQIDELKSYLDKIGTSSTIQEKFVKAVKLKASELGYFKRKAEKASKEMQDSCDRMQASLERADKDIRSNVKKITRVLAV